MSGKQVLNQKEIADNSGRKIYVRNDAQGTIVNDGSFDRILIGYQKDGFGSRNLGLKMSQDGYDVKTATDAQLIMSSEFNMFKILATATVTTDVVAKPVSPTLFKDTTFSFPTGVAATTEPAFLAFSGVPGAVGNQMPFIATIADGIGSYGAIKYIIRCHTSISGGFAYFNARVITYDQSVDVPATSIKYYILQETAA